jgi:transposase
LTRFADVGDLEMSNTAAERAIRAIALGGRNYLFASSDAGGRRAAAVIHTLIETTKLNDVEGVLTSSPSREASENDNGRRIAL